MLFLKETLLVSITFDHVDFVERRPEHKHGDITLINDATINFKMGKFVSVCGKTLVGGTASGHGFGKGVFCGLIAGTHDSSKGRVVLPPHAMVAQVTSSFTEIMDRSVWENLTFGMDNPELLTMETLKYVGSIVSIGSSLLTKTGLELSCGKNGSRISQKNCMAILLMRALLSDPDILLFNGAEVCYTSNQQVRLYQGLKEWVRNGGLAGIGSHTRVGDMPRLRTVVFACISDLNLPAVTDTVVLVGAGEARNQVHVGPVDTYMSSVASVLGAKCESLGAPKPEWLRSSGTRSANHVMHLPKIMPEDSAEYALAFRSVGSAMESMDSPTSP